MQEKHSIDIKFDVQIPEDVSQFDIFSSFFLLFYDSHFLGPCSIQIFLFWHSLVYAGSAPNYFPNSFSGPKENPEAALHVFNVSGTPETFSG